MATINLIVLYPPSDEKIVLNNYDLNQNVSYLRSEICSKLNVPEPELVLVYLGSILDDDQLLSSLELTEWSSIHIIQKKQQKPLREFKPVSDEQLQKIIRDFEILNNSSFKRITKPEAITKITSIFPEIKNDLVAHTILSEPILLASMQKMESLQKLNQHHPCLIAAADVILKTIVELAAAPKLTSPQADDDLSDSSSSSDGGGGAGGPSTSDGASARTITRDQLAAALAYVSTASLNSLANLAERQVNNETAADNSVNESSDPAPSTSGLQNVRITPSMFSNALSQALNSTTSAVPAVGGGNELTSDVVPPQASIPVIIPPPIITPPNETQSNETIYATELQQMREMGLFDEHINMQALVMCNGDVDAAINLIFSGAIA